MEDEFLSDYSGRSEKIMKVAMNGYSIPFPGEEMAEMQDSNELMHGRDKIHQRLSEEGYLLLRGLRVF